MNNYEWLIGRLDAFIRKYYANKVIRGVLVFLSCLLFYFLTVSISEYYLYMPVWLRVSLLSVFIVLGIAALVVWIVVPLSRMWRLGAVISHEEAAGIIGRHFPEVSDRLLNILQLKSRHEGSESRELAEASINQKISRISVVPMTQAVDLSKNRKYLPFLLPLLLVAVFILVAAPNVFRESSSRLLQPTREFEKPAPFRFVIRNASLTAIRNADYTLSIEMQGVALPAEVFVETGTERLPMQALERHCFQYTFRNVSDPVNFRFYAAGYYSHPYLLKVAQRPVLKAFKVQISYPAYIGKKNETRNSLSDMTLPVGTTVSWAFVTDHTDAATIHFGNNGVPVSLLKTSSMYGFQYRFMSDTSYTFTLQNKAGGIADSYRYNVQVIPDQYPVIQLQQLKDTVSGKQVLITGTAGDDHGITRVSFNYEVSDKNKVVARKSIPLKITPGALTTFEKYFDMLTLDLQPGQKVAYYIEAWDNDGVHGSKSSRSDVMTYFMYNEKQMDSAINENAKQINSSISNGEQRNKQLQNEYNDAQSKMLQSNNLDWTQQQSLQDMMKKQSDLKANLESIKQRFEEQMQQTEQKKYSDDLKEKQKELDKQLDNLLNDELKEEMKKLEDLMKKLNKEDAVEAMRKMEQDNKLFKMDMERMDEQMKQMEMQMRMEDLANKMDELAQKERGLENKTEQLGDKPKDKNSNNDSKADKTDKENKDGKDNADSKDSKDNTAGNDKDSKDGSKDAKDDKDAAASKDGKTKDGDDKKAQELSKEQKQLKDQLDKAMKEDMKDLQKLAKDTKQDDKVADEQQDGQDAEQDMQDSKDGLDQQQNSKASKSQKKAAEKMEKMAKSLRSKAGGMGADQIDIDIQATRQVLSNLIRLSFDQEGLMGKVAATPPSDPNYLTNEEAQTRLYRNSKMIRDSLFALSKRVNKLSVRVNKETSELEYNIKKAMDELDKRNTTGARTDQQYVMMHTNNLALMLNELLANLMQMQAESQKPGGQGMCTKPGSKPGQGQGKGIQLSDIITQQKQLGESMQGMSKSGKKPGGKQSGPQSGPGQGQKGGSQGEMSSGENGDAETIARLAAQQAMLRKKIQDLMSQLNSQGMGGAKELREVEQQMDKNETDLVNRRLGTQLIQRQKDIETRMLEVEKAIREQEQDDKRSSRTAQDMSRPVPPALQKYITDQKQLLELYKTVPPSLKPYYREMVENYFHIIGNK
jgi:hypothetical protein